MAYCCLMSNFRACVSMTLQWAQFYALDLLDCFVEMRDMRWRLIVNFLYLRDIVIQPQSVSQYLYYSIKQDD